jgi:hypothetical protein
MFHKMSSALATEGRCPHTKRVFPQAVKPIRKKAFIAALKQLAEKWSL